MAVISVNPRSGARSRVAVGGSPPTKTLEFVRDYVVITDNPLDQAIVIETAPGIPKLGDPIFHPTPDFERRVVDVAPRQDSAQPTVWMVTVTWRSSSDSSGGGPDPEPLNPLLRPAEIQFLDTVSREPIDVDADGNPITNSAGVTFEDPVEKDVSDPIIRIVRNEPSFNQFQAAEYRQSINSDGFFGWDPGQVKCVTLTAVQQREPEFPPYFRVTYEFHVRFDGWQTNKLDVGRIELDDSDEPINITGADDQALSEPVYLDGAGKQLEPNEPPVFLTFDLYPERPFAVFGL